MKIKMLSPKSTYILCLSRKYLPMYGSFLTENLNTYLVENLKTWFNIKSFYKHVQHYKNCINEVQTVQELKKFRENLNLLPKMYVNIIFCTTNYFFAQVMS